MEYGYAIFLATILATLSLIKTEEIFENSKDLCTSRCDCRTTSDNKTFYLDCTDKQFKNVVANWPVNADELIGTFSLNTIKRLEQFPGSSAKLRLVFDHCEIEELASGLFESSVNVLYFDISYNKITSEQLDADVFKGPYNVTYFEPIALEHLNVAYNDIHSLHKNVFEHTPKLKYLNLEGNNFRVLDDVTTLSFGSIPNLQVFNIANNRLTDLPKNALSPFGNLTNLDISNNDLDFAPLSLSIVTTLEVLKMDNNPIITLDDETFMGMHNVLEISARNLTHLKRIRTNTFAPMPKLKKVDLSQNRNLERIDEEAFKPDSKVKELNISDTNMKSLPPNALDWSQLNVLDLSNNQLYCDCDLYNISTLLSDDIKANKDGPYCKNVWSTFSEEIYSLTSEVCKLENVGPNTSIRYMYGNMRALRMSLVMLSVVLIVATFIAALLCYTKWRSWQRSRSYPYASRVIYNPITSNVIY